MHSPTWIGVNNPLLLQAVEEGKFKKRTTAPCHNCGFRFPHIL